MIGFMSPARSEYVHGSSVDIGLFCYCAFGGHGAGPEVHSKSSIQAIACPLGVWFTEMLACTLPGHYLDYAVLTQVHTRVRAWVLTKIHEVRNIIPRMVVIIYTWCRGQSAPIFRGLNAAKSGKSLVISSSP
jgi:hypothetical protein